MEPKIKNIHLLSHDEKENRKIEVELDNDNKVTIVGLYGGFEQYGATQREYAVTVDVAQKFSRWLNGKNL